MLTLPTGHQTRDGSVVEFPRVPGSTDLQDEVDGLARALRAGFTTLLLVFAVVGLLVASPLMPHPIVLLLGGFLLFGLLSGPAVRGTR